MDFTLYKYKELLQVFLHNGYSFQTLDKFRYISGNKEIILRHDVENDYRNAIAFAQIEKSLNIKGSYYFRYSKRGFNKEIIQSVAQMGHEIGYHYDDLSFCNGNINKAKLRFIQNLQSLRQMVTVTTITMEGSPLSRYNNGHIWNHIDYKDYGIQCEPYFDIDYKNVFYLTDTGRKWNGYNFNLRDKIPEAQKRWKISGLIYHSTDEIISSVNSSQFPGTALITFHPQRWSNNVFRWMIELIFQSTKNIFKYMYLLSKGEII